MDEEHRRRCEKAKKSTVSCFRMLRSVYFNQQLKDTFLNVNPYLAQIFAYESPEDVIDSVKDVASQMFCGTSQSRTDP